MATPTTERLWAKKLSRDLKAELKRAEVTYGELAGRLTRMGLPETEASISNKLARGTFSAVFLVAAMKALGYDAFTHQFERMPIRYQLPGLLTPAMKAWLDANAAGWGLVEESRVVEFPNFDPLESFHELFGPELERLYPPDSD